MQGHAKTVVSWYFHGFSRSSSRRSLCSSLARSTLRNRSTSRGIRIQNRISPAIGSTSEPDSRNYTQTMEVETPSATVPDLTEGVVYYFAVTAYNTEGVESGYSNEVSYAVPTSTRRQRQVQRQPHTPTPDPNQLQHRSQSPSPPPDGLLNISTRVRVRSGDSVLIGGFIVTGDATKEVVIRALGPSLARSGVSKVLPNPEVELYDSSGTLIDQNADWTSLPPGSVPVELQPTDPTEAVIVAACPQAITPRWYGAKTAPPAWRCASSTISRQTIPACATSPPGERLGWLTTS